MEAVVFQDSPLADYLEGKGEGGSVSEWADAESKGDDDSAPPSPSFAPRGKPTARLKFRQSLPPPLRLTIPRNVAIAAIHDTCSKAVNSRLGRVENARFLEQFRYIIVASQLLSGTSYLGSSRDTPLPTPDAPQVGAFTLAGAAVTATLGFSIAWLIHWTRGRVAKGRMLILLGFLSVLALVSYAYVRRQWLQYLRQRALAETSEFVAKAQELDVVATAALNLIQEVELVSRGYRLSTPLPPISRLEDRHQTRRCSRLRKALRLCFADVIPRYSQACTALKPLTECLDLEKYYDIYDISDMDSADALLGYSEAEFEDVDSLRALKILAARFHTIRKIFLCCLLALDAHGGKPDFLRWGTALDEIHAVSAVTAEAEERMRRILTEEESFPVPPTPKMPLTPRGERWRTQLRKLNSLSSGIRGLQAKLHVLKEESDRTINSETEDFSEFGADLMSQYESIGVDLKSLMQEWEDGKAALASNIDRNERRISSMSTAVSPAISLSGLTSVEEGTPLDALKALNGERRSQSSLDFSGSEAEEVFEAIAMPRQRSSLTREQRIAKMKEDRARRESSRDRQEANTRMLRELESVINLRPKRTTPNGRVTTL
ncbi:Mysoin-binding motif of peroxisomes-domain-containing protein [Xylogone sp. PMI_703]|nr:Mysoin-binding motif of peroxisomes-domain-containing protein [Xylogone sp. PMI_703]